MTDYEVYMKMTVFEDENFWNARDNYVDTECNNRLFA